MILVVFVFKLMLLKVREHLKRLWIAAFRAMDDIKETVRNAGDKLCRSVTSLTIRICDITLTEISDAKQAMDIVLPFLLSEGIMSKVSSVRKASIAVVMKLAKVSPNFDDLELYLYMTIRSVTFSLYYPYHAFISKILL